MLTTMKSVLVGLLGVVISVAVVMLVFSNLPSDAHASFSGVASGKGDVTRWGDATAQLESWLGSKGLQPRDDASIAFQSSEDNWVWRDGGGEIGGVGARTMESCVVYQGEINGIGQAKISIAKGSRPMGGEVVDPAFYWVIVGIRGTISDREVWRQLREQIRVVVHDGVFTPPAK